MNGEKNQGACVMTRRRFLSGAVGTGGLMLLAACSPASSSSGGPVPTTAPAAGAKPAQKSTGGQIILSSNTEPLTLNPAFTPVSTTYLLLPAPLRRSDPP